MNDSLIELKGVTKKFGKNIVLDSIDLKISEDKITGIIGASGEGKSTILKMIASFYKPTSGKIFYLGRDVLKDTQNIKKTFGIAIEDGSFYEELTVKENLLHFGKLYKIKNKTLIPRISGLMKFVGLFDARDIIAKNLSLGMKKRLDIACALVHKPKVLILDEPTADLDPLLRFHMIKLIKKINSHKTTIIFTTQLLKEAEEICDIISLLYNEKIIAQDTPAKIKSKYNAKSLDDVFRKIFSKQGRKTYQESKEEKTLLKNGDEIDENRVTKEELEEVFGSKKVKK